MTALAVGHAETGTGRTSAAGRAAMTLVELLVVIAIMAILVVTVAPNVAANAGARRNREGARALSTFVAKAQALAVGRRNWSGFTIDATGTVGMATELYLAEVPDIYRGDQVPATLTIVTTASSGTAAARANGSALSMTGTMSLGGQRGQNVSPGDLIRFDGRGPFYEIVTSPGTTTTSSGTIMLSFRLRGHTANAIEDAGFQPHNTPFPPTDRELPFEILRRPLPLGSPSRLPDGVAVDLLWSGYGPPAVGGVTNTYRPFSTFTTSWFFSLARVYVLFDGTGRLRQLIGLPFRPNPTWWVESNASRATVTGPVFLLVGRAGRAGNAYHPSAPSTTDESLGANWQYPDSFWVVIDPMTGITKTAECAPNPTGATDLDKCVDSQRFVRQALVSDGR